ncbi:MAG: hypothetical protein WKH97_14820 [Casimicrobiaceae bacterium]
MNDGKPVSRHAFDGLQYITHANRFFGYDGARAKDARREIGGYSEMSEMSKMRYSKMAAMLDVQIPQSLLLRADEVIH